MNAWIAMAAISWLAGTQDHGGYDASQTSAHAAAKDTQRNFLVHKASDAVGTEVVNRTGESLGEVEDIVVRPDGTIAYAVLSFGGFLDIGDKLFALPWGCMQAEHGMANDKGDTRLVLDVPKERLEKAPSFDQDSWPTMADAAFCGEVDSYYANDMSKGMSSKPVAASATSHRILRCSDLTGMAIENRADEKLGDIKDLVLDPSNGRVSYVVLSCGGFLGLGDRLVAVPWSALEARQVEDETELTLDITKDRLKLAPEFVDDEDQWARMASADWIRNDVYGFYGVQPYWKEREDGIDSEVSDRVHGAEELRERRNQ